MWIKTYILIIAVHITLLTALPISSLPKQCNGESCTKSQVTSLPGHWPVNYCKVTKLAFNLGDKAIKISSDSLKDLEKCFKVQDIWKFAPRMEHEEVNELQCDQVFTTGHFFTVYYYHGSNYFHLHYDTLLPLFAALNKQEDKESVSNKEAVLLPAVEASRGEGLDWNTEAFLNPTSYWMQMLQLVAGKHRILPLDRRLLAVNKTMCFEEAYFGTPRVNFSDKDVLNSYISFVKKHLRVKDKEVAPAGKPKIGLIHREGRRRILNEKDLINSISSFATVESIDFSALSVQDQVRKVQEYSVLIGMNGAGLINALYLPRKSVAVQLVPYKAQLNVEEFGNLLRARGPYLEWHNTHSELNRPAPEDPFNNGSDTEVHVAEFVTIVKQALELYKQQSIS